MSGAGLIANIANPIYDGAFKFLLSDNATARLFLSALTGMEITELEFRPTETRSVFSGQCLTVLRMDFAAKARTSEGREKLVLIEIEKAKLPDDVMRFRRYLASQYASGENLSVREEPDGERKPLEIFTICFLGHKLKHTTEPVIWVRREMYGLGGDPNRRIEGVREEFIEALTHDCIVVQIPCLTNRRRTELERLLAAFDQSKTLPGDARLLSVDAGEIPERYAPVLRRLGMAAAQPSVREEMELEEAFLRELEERERDSLRKLEQRTRELEATSRELEQTNRELKITSRELEQANRALQQANRELEHGNREIEQRNHDLEQAQREKAAAQAEAERLKALLAQKAGA